MTVMTPEGKKPNHRVVVAAVSGGPDSVYLLRMLSSDKKTRIVVGHVNYATRGKDSVKDQLLVENIGKRLGYNTDILVIDSGKSTGGRTGIRGRFPAGFEKRAREVRYRFLRDLSEKVGAEAIALAHTADDQVETILMRVFEGAGIGGLKGIPRETADGIVRPILDEWKEDILGYLKKRKIPYRIDRSNVDTRFERNWVRHVLIPLLEKRYGKSVKKRIFTLGERFRELDDYLEAEAGRWIRRNVKMSGGVVFRRKTFSALPSVLRVKILQRICFDRLGVAPNERLLKAMDGNVSHGGPSARMNVGKGWKLANRYEEARFVAALGDVRGKAVSKNRREDEERRIKKEEFDPLSGPGSYILPSMGGTGTTRIVWEGKGKVSPVQAKRLAAKGDAEVFDAAGLTLPLTVRPLRAGDRIRPFGGSAGGNARDGEKKVKEILIDRKIPRDDRWGRPVVCDAEGAILWIPGVLRSEHAPVTPQTRKTAILRIPATKWTRTDRVLK
jgi:tRNA(Ile)-lysidine synthase